MSLNTYYKKLDIVQTPIIIKKTNDATKFWDRFKVK